MKKQIMIDIPEGKELLQTTDENGIITIKFVDIKPARSESWEEFINNHPEEVAFAENMDCPIDLATDIKALIKLTKLREEWVGDWRPNYSGMNNKNWHIHYQKDGLIITWNGTQARFLAFPTYAMASEFLHCFKDLIEEAKKFI